MPIFKHVDFQVPGWRELSLGPAGNREEFLRPFRFRVVGFRPNTFRPTANHGAVLLGN